MSGMVERPSRMSTSGREAFPDVREWSNVREGLSTTPGHSGGPPGCPGVVGRSDRLSRSGRETLPDVPDCSVDPPGCSGVVGWPYRMSMSGREFLPDVEVVGGPYGYPGVVGDPSGCPAVVRSPPRCPEGPLGCPAVIERPSWMSRSGRETRLDVWEWSRDSPGCP